MVKGIYLSCHIFPVLLCLCWLHPQICPSHMMCWGPSEIALSIQPTSYATSAEREHHLCSSPRKNPVLFGLSFGHIINQFLWQVRKIYMDGPALDHMPNPEPRRGPSKSGSTEGEWRAYKAQRKVLLRYLFLLTAPWFLPSILIEMACTCCWALSDCSLTQIRFVYPLPCHYYIESGSVSWFDICTVLP